MWPHQRAAGTPAQAERASAMLFCRLCFALERCGYFTSCCLSAVSKRCGHSDLRPLTFVRRFQFSQNCRSLPFRVDPGGGCELVTIPADQPFFFYCEAPQYTDKHVDHVQSHFNPLYTPAAGHLLHVHKPERVDLLQLASVNNHNKVAGELPVTCDAIP